MRLRRKSLVGKIDSKGELKAPWNTLYDFCTMHKDRAVIIRAEIMPKEPSEKVQAYYFGYIIPEFQDAIMQAYGERLTKSQTDEWIRCQCPLFIEETRENGRWRKRIREFEELDPAEANEAIEWMFQFASENLNLVIDDAL